MTSLLSSATVLFFILDPFGNVPKVLVTMRGIEKSRRERILVRELLIALALMVLFLFAGQHLLNAMNVSQKSLSVGGGVLLLLIAIRMVFPPASSGQAEQAEAEEPFIVPLAIPYFAGPATLATVAVMGTKQPDHRLVWLGAIVAAWFAASVVMFFGSRLAGVLGKRGLVATERLMGMILVMISVEMLFTGVASFVEGMSTQLATAH